MKPMCVPCQRFYRCDRTGVYVLEQMPIGQDAPPGTEAPERWEPYKIWAADRWRCEGCGHLLISGWGSEAVSEQHKPDFADWMNDVTATVNDC